MINLDLKRLDVQSMTSEEMKREWAGGIKECWGTIKGWARERVRSLEKFRKTLSQQEGRYVTFREVTRF